MKVFVCIVALAVAISSCDAALIAGLPSSMSTECSKFTVDKCLEGGIYETVNNIADVATCQEYCSVIFADKCTFFMLDKKQKLCMIMDQSMEEYVNTCKKVVGPSTPSLSYCQSSPSPCDTFVEGYCQYEGSILEHFDGLDQLKCQASCRLTPGCQIFAYDGSAGISNCELYGTITSAACDLIRGPPSPDYITC